jgi:multiple antibiotic resistance protein
MEHQLQAIVTVLSLVNPVICGTMFARIETGQPRATQLLDATKAALAVLVILIVTALIGARILQVFGISLEAFSIAGGGLLALIGFSMLRESPSHNQDVAKESACENRSIAPVVLFAASPGTITGVITLAVTHSKLDLPITALVAVAVATPVMWIAMVLMARGGTHAPGGFMRETATRFMGLIVVAMGVQFALTGIQKFMTSSSL